MRKLWHSITNLSTRDVYLLNAAWMAGLGLGLLLFPHDLDGIFVLCGSAGWVEAARHIR